MQNTFFFFALSSSFCVCVLDESAVKREWSIICRVDTVQQERSSGDSIWVGPGSNQRPLLYKSYSEPIETFERMKFLEVRLERKFDNQLDSPPGYSESSICPCCLTQCVM